MKNNIHNTALVPYLIAEKVTENIDFQDLLISKSENTYKTNKIWRNQLDNSPDQREFLKMFMIHWVKRIEKSKNLNQKTNGNNIPK
jgi:hypothetical protein